MALHPPVRTNVEAFIGAHPLLLSLLALTSSASIELFQAWPEIVPLGQEVGEVIRNLGYGIAAAFAFNWIMVDIPRKQEERRILDSYWWHLNRMAHSSGMLLASYRELAPDGEYDTTTEHGMKALLSEIDLIEAYTVPAPNVSITTNGIKNIWSDPFADTTEIKEIEGFGLAVLPFIHRLHPAVADAVTELVHFRQNMNGLEPISMPPGKLDKEFGRIWPFIASVRRLRCALVKHYPQRELQKLILLDIPDRPTRQILDADL